MSQRSDQSPDAHLSAVLKETYRVDALLGKGGMGAVYRTTHLRLGSKVAVKLLLSGVSNNPEAQHRFRREAKVAMDLSDENIVHIHDYDVTPEGMPFIVMEYLEGEDLGARISREAPLHLEIVVDLARQIGSALSAAHGQGVVHRDLKPENIFLKRRATGEEVVKVVDFGIAKVLDSESMVTRTGALMGTPLFMAPEQARQETRSIDGRADIFSFGCILYYMLSGQMPFYGKKYAQVLLQIISKDPPPLRSMVPLLPEEVEQVVHRALAKDPQERYQSVDLMMHALCNAAGVSWGTALEQVETVVTGNPALLPEDDAEFGLAETIPPDAPIPETIGLVDSAVTPASVTGAQTGTGAAMGTAPTVDPTRPPAPQPPVELLCEELDEPPTVPMPIQPGASPGRRLPMLVVAVALILGAGGVSTWLVIQRYASSTASTLPGPAGTSPLAQQEWAAADGGRHAATADITKPAVPLDAAAPDRSRAPDKQRAAAGRKHSGRPPRKVGSRRATLQVKARAGGQEVTAVVFINGRRIGRSPSKTRLAPGKHMVRVRRHGLPPVDREVELKAGQREILVVDLD